MSTGLSVIETSLYPILVPDNNIAELLAANLGNEDVSEFDLPQIKVPSGGGGSWSIPTATGEEESQPEFEGIICHVARRRQYWASQDPTGDPPDCTSRDMLTGVGDPGGECKACQFNEFGSSKNERGKACKEVRALFIARPREPMPIVLNVPPGSLKNCKQYLLVLRLPYWQLVTRFSLERTKNADGIAYSQIRFRQIGVVPGDSLPMLREYAAKLREVFA